MRQRTSSSLHRGPAHSCFLLRRTTGSNPPPLTGDFTCHRRCQANTRSARLQIRALAQRPGVARLQSARRRGRLLLHLSSHLTVFCLLTPVV
ncbi:hypothetical protein CC78DRAFT_135276 [Lojkania enalia]|uniref:Uncharacterized protein n=1 Tax=Lojkania enalia TaxID=147567 RepID=A0A9P4NCK8_9PLEO|nr:hypothetical protein CC78DRAFT_135276 [Didymosphaeria enalia]